MSFWTDVRTPTWGAVAGGLVGGPVGAGIGAGVGFGADAVTGGGAFSRPGYSVDYSGQPQYPGYAPIYNPMSMGIQPQLNAKLDANKVNTQGLDKFRAEATRTGPSEWANRATHDQDLLAMQQRDQVARAGAGQQAQARSQLAMQGGITGGAAERLARSGENRQMIGSQDVGRQANLNKSQISMNDESNRIQQLGMVPGMDLAKSNFDLDKTKLWGQGFQYDTNNQIQANKYANDWNMHQYDSQMAAWAAGQQANATANSGKK